MGPFLIHAGLPLLLQFNGIFTTTTTNNNNNNNKIGSKKALRIIYKKRCMTPCQNKSPHKNYKNYNKLTKTVVIFTVLLQIG